LVSRLSAAIQAPSHASRGPPVSDLGNWLFRVGRDVLAFGKYRNGVGGTDHLHRSCGQANVLAEHLGIEGQEEGWPQDRTVAGQLADPQAWRLRFHLYRGSHWTIDVLEDAVAAFRLAKTGGIIGFDDYKWNDPKYNQNGAPKLAIDAFLKVYKPKIALLTKNYQVWARKEAD
jgi:hypothetical protein